MKNELTVSYTVTLMYAVSTVKIILNVIKEQKCIDFLKMDHLYEE